MSFARLRAVVMLEGQALDKIQNDGTKRKQHEAVDDHTADLGSALALSRSTDGAGRDDHHPKDRDSHDNDTVDHDGRRVFHCQFVFIAMPLNHQPPYLQGHADCKDDYGPGCNPGCGLSV